MKLSDLFYFLGQILFPHRKREVDDDAPPGRAALLMDAAAKKLHSRETLSTVFSVLLHAVVVAVMAILVLPVSEEWTGIDILSRSDVPKAEKIENDIPIDVTDLSDDNTDKAEDSDVKPDPMENELGENVSETVTTITLHPNSAPVADLRPDPEPIETGGITVKEIKGQFVPGGGFEGRNGDRKARILGDLDGDGPGGGRLMAIERGLQWLAAHQEKDGGWSFEFQYSCGQCTCEGSHGSRVAATSLALLAFLGNGETHLKGRYTRNVSRGLNYLMLKGAPGTRGLDLTQSKQGMYPHGLATIALCEAFGMEKSPPELGRSAQEALRFIENAQNQQLGGWRYLPNAPMGDLSVTTWQVMALKSGKLAELNVMQPTIYLANDFLDSVAYDQERQYRYLPDAGRKGDGPDSAKTCTACGLMLRMYLGWEPGQKALDGGVDLVSKWGPLEPGSKRGEPTTCNLYYAYYATLVMHHYGGSDWRAWNSQIRDFLIQTQSDRGHEAGSWYFPDHYCDSGGRLLNTALAVMILETPFRFMPLYRTFE